MRLFSEVSCILTDSLYTNHHHLIKPVTAIYCLPFRGPRLCVGRGMPALFTEALLAPTAQYSGAYAPEFSGMNEPSYVRMKGKSQSTQAT